MSGGKGRGKLRYCQKCKYRRVMFKRRKGGGRYFKFLVGGVVVHGMACVSMSYALAWQEHTQVVESVSSAIITEIVAPVIIYGLTKTVENVFQKNKLSFSEPIKNEISTGVEESEELG